MIARMNLSGCNALVTGGAVRIGREICRSLASEGVSVVVHYDRSKDAAEALCRELRSRGVRSFQVQGDLRKKSECLRVLGEAWDLAGRLDCLVNNAAVFEKFCLFSTTELNWDETLAINCVAPVALTMEFARRVKSAGTGTPAAGGCVIQGRVVNLLDRRISCPDPECMPYWISKKMLESFTKCSALELAPAITVNAVAPGAVLPPSSRTEGVGRAVVSDAMGYIPLGCRCTAEDVAAAVVYLLKSETATGQILYVDGGQYLVGNGDAGGW